MTGCKRFQSFGLPVPRDADRNAGRNILVSRRNDKQRRARRSLHLNPRICRSQHRPGFIAPMPAGVQRRGVIGIRQRRSRRRQACIALPRHHFRPLTRWQLAMPGRGGKWIHQHQRIRMFCDLQGNQTAEARSNHHARTRQGEQCLQHLRAVVLECRCRQSERRRHQVRRMHVDAMRLQYAVPDVPLPSTATCAVDEQCVWVTQPAWLPRSPAPTMRAK